VNYLAPRVVRIAVQVIEAQPHLPLTVSSLAAQSHVTERALQQGFRRHPGMTPMAHLREVRLRRAWPMMTSAVFHRRLLETDASAETVAAIAKRCGFITNPGRFAAAHVARYDEPPAGVLRRSISPVVLRERRADGLTQMICRRAEANGVATVRPRNGTVGRPAPGPGRHSCRTSILLTRGGGRRCPPGTRHHENR
jgi:AraC-like DNA-binding protein